MIRSIVFERLRLKAPAVPVNDTAEKTGIDVLAASAAALQQQQEILEELRASRDTLAQLTLRESQLRAVLRRDAELDGALAGLEPILGSPQIAAHVRRAIDAAELRTHPFPYAIVDDLLPADLYGDLLEGIPPPELFAGRPFNEQELHVPLTLAPTYSLRVWRFMATAVNQHHVTPGVLQKFEQPVSDWVRRQWPDVSWSSLETHTSNGRIMLRGRGYCIPPHRDPKWGFITCLFYLARSDDSDRWGTQFYTVDEDEEARGTKPHWIDPGRCRLAEDISFRANRMLVFLNSQGAHGAQIPSDAPEDLRRYTYQFRIGPAAPAMAHLMSLLPEDKRDYWAGKLKE